MAELIVALDHTDPADAVAFLDKLPAQAAVKVGSVLLARAGIGFVRGLVLGGHPVFLDPKWHDIPNTVAGAVAAAADLGVDMVTVHALGGEAMLRAACEAAGGRTHVVAVTVLTSHDVASWVAVTGRDHAVLDDEVARLARLAIGAGVDGVVCSAHEIAGVRSILGARRIVVPGVRRASDRTGDQERVATPEAATRSGATHLVVGRPITESPEPGQAYQEFLSAMA